MITTAEALVKEVLLVAAMMRWLRHSGIWLFCVVRVATMKMGIFDLLVLCEGKTSLFDSVNLNRLVSLARKLISRVPKYVKTL